ncbi:hypothetical protein ACFVZ2_43395, partial [Streptomyces lasiicapitis]
MYRKALSLALVSTAVAATTVAAVATPGTPGATTDTMTTASTVTATPRSLEWGPCPKEAASPRLACTTLDVPLDYRDTHGRPSEIAVSRMAS